MRVLAHVAGTAANLFMYVRALRSAGWTNRKHKACNSVRGAHVRGNRALKIDADTSVHVRVRRGVAALASCVIVCILRKITIISPFAAYCVR